MNALSHTAAWARDAAPSADAPTAAPVPAHPRFVRITHWLTTIATIALVISGVELIVSHPRFNWGEVGNVNTTPLFSIPIPSSRSTVPTGYSFALPDQNGWSRSLHFQSAWLVLFAGMAYLVAGARSGHVGRRLVPAPPDRTWRALRASIGGHQSARTLHFVAMIALVLFTVVHVAMVARAGFRRLMRAMLTGTSETRP